jgi:hypothetical protein
LGTHGKRTSAIIASVGAGAYAGSGRGSQVQFVQPGVCRDYRTLFLGWLEVACADYRQKILRLDIGFPLHYGDLDIALDEVAFRLAGLIWVSRISGVSVHDVWENSLSSKSQANATGARWTAFRPAAPLAR